MTNQIERSTDRLSDDGDPAYRVGYKKPPKHAQFAKGSSGNPHGRPKRPKGISLKELFDTDQTTKNGTSIRTRDVVVNKILKDAMDGKPRAFKWFLDLMKLSGLIRLEPPKLGGQVIYFDGNKAIPAARYHAERVKKAELEARARDRVIRQNAQASESSQRIRSNRPLNKALGFGVDENMIAIFKRLATRRIKVTQHGKHRMATLAEAILLKNFEAALHDSPMAMHNIIRLAEQAGEFIDLTDPEKVGKPLFMPRSAESIEEVLARFGAKVVRISSQKDLL
jgi:uncharacterized protein DUF5681